MSERTYPELDFCSRCREHTDFQWDNEGHTWLSVCCGAPPVEVDPT